MCLFWLVKSGKINVEFKSVLYYVSLQDFGKSMSFHDLNVEWKFPDENGVLFVEKLVDEILEPCVAEIDSFTAQLKQQKDSGSKVELALTRDDLLKKLSIIHCFVEGLCGSLAGLDEEHTLTLSNKCDLMPNVYPEEFLVTTLKNYDSLRKTLALKIHDLLDAMLADDVLENDVKSLSCISKLIRSLLLAVGGHSKLSMNLSQMRTSKTAMMGKKRFKDKKVLFIPSEISEISIHYQVRSH